MIASILAWLGPRVAANALVIAKWIFIALILLAAIFGIKRYGKLEQKVKDYEAGIKGIQNRSKIERELRRAPESELDKWL